MFSGKSEELIRRLKRVQIAKRRAQVFYHAFDVRYGEHRIASHSGLSIEAVADSRADEILPQIHPDTEVVAIDEAQFFDASVATAANTLADRRLRVIVAGLDTDFRGEPFGSMPRLMAEAEIVDKLQAICLACGASASRTQRLIDGQPAHYADPVIMVGASEVYEARCRDCHQVPGREAS